MIDAFVTVFILIVIGKIVKAAWDKWYVPPSNEVVITMPEPTIREAAESWVEKNRPVDDGPFWTQPLTLAELDELDDLFN